MPGQQACNASVNSLFMWCTLWMASRLASSGSRALARWCRYARLQQMGSTTLCQAHAQWLHCRHMQ